MEIEGSSADLVRALWKWWCMRIQRRNAARLPAPVQICNVVVSIHRYLILESELNPLWFNYLRK